MSRKLIYILNQYSLHEGSHYYHIINLIEEIASQGTTVFLIIEKGQDVPVVKNKDIRIYLQKETGLKRSLELISLLKKLNRNGYKKTFIRISQIAAIPAILITRLYGGEVYFWQSGTTHNHSNKSFKKYIKSDIPFFLVKTFTDYFVTGPESMMDYYEKEVGVQRNKLICLYNDIDINRFKPLNVESRIELKKALGIEPDTRIILFVKRMSSIKGILYYSPYIIERNIDLLRSLNYQCIYIGDGSEKEKLEKSVNDKGLADIIKIIGKRPNQIIQKYYQVSDIFINPTKEEGFPRVLIEAMASGLPVVTTDAGGIKDIVVGNQKDFMVNKNDRELFSQKLEKLILNNEVQKCLSIENQSRVVRFSTQEVAKMYINKIFENE